MENRMVADWLVDYAHFLECCGASLYRARAYRRAAETVLGLKEPVASIASREGCKGLRALPGIGRHIAYTIDVLIRTGEFRTWRDKTAPEQMVDRKTSRCHADAEGIPVSS